MLKNNPRLYEILIDRRKEVSELKSRFPLAKILKAIERDQLLADRRDFKKAVAHSHQISIIGEIKKASPSEGVIRNDFNPLKIAAIYECAPIIKAISVLTESRYFKGRTSYLKTIRKVTSKPILRKDFIVDRYQIYESALYSADAVLLLANILTDEELKNYIQDLKEFGMAALVEVHAQNDLEKALEAGAEIIGINNRDLTTFHVNLDVTVQLLRKIPKDKIVITESGIQRKEDIQFYRALGLNAFLIGTVFMRSPTIIEKINEFSSI